MMVAAAGLTAWAMCWPYGALLAAANGIWTRPRAAWVLQLLPLRFAVAIVRSNFLDLLSFLRTVLLGLALFGIAAFALTNSGASDAVQLMVVVGFFALVALPALFVIVVLGLVAGSSFWRWRRDIRIVSEIGSPQGSDALGRLQEYLGRLKTDNGVQSLLQEARRREFQRVPEVADFLYFLSQCVERRDDEEEAVPTPAHDRADWTRWWDEYRARFAVEAPLLWPSSETIDELGRTLEDVWRASAFRS